MPEAYPALSQQVAQLGFKSRSIQSLWVLLNHPHTALDGTGVFRGSQRDVHLLKFREQILSLESRVSSPGLLPPSLCGHFSQGLAFLQRQPWGSRRCPPVGQTCIRGG